MPSPSCLLCCTSPRGDPERLQTYHHLLLFPFLLFPFLLFEPLPFPPSSPTPSSSRSPPLSTSLPALSARPLDFAAHFLEAEHEGAVTAVHASPDGLKLLIGTASGTIGVLDVPTLKHATIVRSHTDIIYGLSLDPHNREFATASCDGSIRVWELDGNQAQLVEFEMPSGCSRAVAYHPTEYSIACGFDDGSIRVFDIASTSLLEEYTQHQGKVVDLLFAHNAEKLYSAGADGVLCAYDVVHAYQPSRTYSAAPGAEPASPCLAITKDDLLLVAGSLQKAQLLLFEASTLSLLASIPMASDITSVAIGPARTLFMSSADGSLLSLPLAPPGTPLGTGTASLSNVASSIKCHKSAIDAVTLTRNGKHVVSGGNDRMIRMWPEAAVRAGAATSKGGAIGPAGCQPYAGHSDLISQLRFSSDGQTLISVGGGDAIYIWNYLGKPGVDEGEMVEESVRQAEASRADQLRARRAHEAVGNDTLPTPAQVMGSAADGSDEDDDSEEVDDDDAAAAAPAAAAARSAGAFPPPSPGVTTGDLERLRQRLRAIDTAQAGYMMAGVEAAVRASEAAAAAARGEPPPKYATDDDDSEAEEIAAGGVPASPAPQSCSAPRKRFTGSRASRLPPSTAGAGAPDLSASDEPPQSPMEAARAVLEQVEQEAAAAEYAEDVAAAASGGLAGACATGLRLSRIIGVSTHAHDHVHWQPTSGVLCYATGDTLVVDRMLSGKPPSYLIGGSGEIATVALSPDGRFAATGSGGDSVTCVYDLQMPVRDEDSTSTTMLHMRLPGHVGGVQCLAFLGNAALATLGLTDCTLKVYSLSSGAMYVQTTTPPDMCSLTVSSDGMEITAAGKGGLFTWRFAAQSTPEGSRAVLTPMPTRAHPAEAAADDEKAATQLTALATLSPALTLAGDASGQLTLWAPAGSNDGEAIVTFDLSSTFSEIDVLHATPIEPETPDGQPSSWLICVGGCSPAAAVGRYQLNLGGASEHDDLEVELLPKGEIQLDGDALAASWQDDGEQGVIGTDTGSLWHVQWPSNSRTLLSAGVPPPLAAMAVPRCETPAVLATLSSGAVQGSECGVLLWDHHPHTPTQACAGPLARIYQPNEPATCVALSPPHEELGRAGADVDGSSGLCAVGYTTGRVQIVCVAGLKLLKERRVHHAPIAAIMFGPSATLITASETGEVRLHVAALGQLLAPLATLRAPNGVAVSCLDVFYGSPELAPRWAVGSAHQQVQVWPLTAKTDPSIEPITSLTLESKPILTLPDNLRSLGWRCLVAFLPFRPSVIACCGLTRRRQLVLYDTERDFPLSAFPMDEWPTALAACAAAPLLALAGASGKVKLLEYLAPPETEAEIVAEEKALDAAADSGDAVAGLLRSAEDVELHCNNVREVHFAGAKLFSAADDEVAHWDLPLVPT